MLSSKEDELRWLRLAEQEYSLQHAREQDFEMNGQALCILTKDDCPLRSLGSGQGHSLASLMQTRGSGGGGAVLLPPSPLPISILRPLPSISISTNLVTGHASCHLVSSLPSRPTCS